MVLVVFARHPFGVAYQHQVAGGVCLGVHRHCTGGRAFYS
jgi:hypothetical protein